MKKECRSVRNVVLVVDDVEMNREILSEMLEDEYEILEADNGVDALKIITERSQSLVAILLDLVMPVMGGLEVLKCLQADEKHSRIPALVISSEQSVEIERECFQYGVHDFIHKPFDPELVRRRVKNAADLFIYRNNLEQTVAEQTAELREQNARLQRLNSDIVEMLGNVVEARSMESGQHVRRVKGYTGILAEEMMRSYPEYNLTPESISLIVEASALHDVGKIMIRDSVLLKPGRLTPEEFDYMKTHTTLGCKLINEVTDMWSDEYRRCGYEICRHHHEKYDGRGYPDGLKGDEIPISAQLVSVADIYDALTTERVYKKAFSADEAYRMIREGECGAFSDKMMNCFARVKDQMSKLISRPAAAANEPNG